VNLKSLSTSLLAIMLVLSAVGGAASYGYSVLHATDNTTSTAIATTKTATLLRLTAACNSGVTLHGATWTEGSVAMTVPAYHNGTSGAKISAALGTANTALQQPLQTSCQNPHGQITAAGAPTTGI